MKNIKFSLLFCMLLFTGIANATDYYVSNLGSNSNNGTSATTSWQTLSKVQTVFNNGTIKAGDNIYFKKGDVFSENLLIASIWGYSANSGTATQPITLSSYGTGAKPIFQYPAGATNLASQRSIIWLMGVNYIVVDGINFTDLVHTTNDKVTPAYCAFALYLGISGEVTTNHCTVKNIDVSLLGMGIAISGDFNTISNSTFTNFKNLISTSGGGDDYGANPFSILSGNDNNISNNYVSGGWAESLDFGYNGGFCEMYGACNRNKFFYNTIIDCNGLSEFGGTGSNLDNLYAYNKIIDCGAMYWVNSGAEAGNIQFFNNTVIETNNSRFSQGSANAGAGVVTPEAISHLNTDGYMFAYNGSPAASVVFNLKNNIIQISTPLKIARSGEAKMAHDYNVAKLSGGSNFGLTLNTHDKSTTAVIFTNTTAANAASWDLTPPPASPEIDAGVNVGITSDFAGNPVPAVPNAGILEGAGGVSSLAATSAAGTVTCNGGTTTITVNASGGTAPYTGTGTFNVTAGTYTYNVTDAAGTVRTTSATVTQPLALSATLSAGIISILGGTTSLTVNGSGGTAPYTYKLNSGSYQSSNVFSGVPAGVQSVTMKDANGCTISSLTITITQPSANPITVTSISGIIGCNGGTATVTVSATGGITPYSGTGTFTVTAGTYNYTVTDAAGTIGTTSVVITQPTALNPTVSAGIITVNGGTTSITANCTGGTPTFTYKLNSGAYQSTGAFTNVVAGTYTITVKDKNGCTATKSISITQPAIPVIVTLTPGSINCNGATTTVAVSASGGVSPFTGTGTFTVSAGTYTYTVTDAAGTSAVSSVTIAQPTAITASVLAPGVYSATAKTTATVTASGGTPAYTYSLDAGNYQSANTFSNVAVGTHSLKVKDSKGCIKTTSFTVVLLPLTPLTISSTSGFMDCYGGTTTVTINAAGGIPPYIGTGSFSVSAGTRTYTVTDASGATASKTITTVQPHIIVATVTNGAITIFGGSTNVTVTATGGTGSSYSYRLNAGAYQSSNAFSNVTAGTYTVTVKDVRGCTVTKGFTITQPAAVFHISLVSKTDLTCSGANNGTIKVAGLNGTAPYTYKKNNGNYSSNNTYTNLAPATYTITCKDASGATSSMQVTIASSQVSCFIAGKNSDAGKINNDIQNEVVSQPSGLELTAFPNPSNTQFSLVAKSNSDKNIHFSVMNMNGQKVYENNFTVNRIITFGNSFTPGIYFVKVVQGNNVQVIKLIKN
ncbi:MAG: T9SS type A sorting domain-containing protein [Ferruginibacter sp.]